ncbi:MAG: PEP-CTERM sorting domain-containing protein [Phycisphaerae bacterium]|nr:PEP-CTERM sorting domain-containing protein [Phycisphaerae bacterium]
MVMQKMSRQHVRCVWTSLLVIGVVASVASAASFQGLGFLPDATYSGAGGVSADGSIVIGRSDSRTFVWTQAEGMRRLDGFTNDMNEAWAGMSDPWAISADGSTVVGVANVTYGAFRWTQDGGVQRLGDFTAYGVNATGSVVVGSTGWHAVRWTESDGMQQLFDPGAVLHSTAYGVNADGSVVVGSRSVGEWWFIQEAFRWSVDGGAESLGFLPGGNGSCAVDVSADGTVIVGYGGTDLGLRAFRWTESDGMQLLTESPGWTDWNEATAVNADGSVVVGFWGDTMFFERGRAEAFVWDQTHGARSIKGILERDFGMDLTGWDLMYASGVSADGTVIVGYGMNPLGQAEAWIAVIPEPSSAALLAVAAMSFLSRRRCR